MQDKKRVARQIREALEREFEGLQVREIGDAGSALEVPAAHERVGPLRIQIDRDEITVFVGPTHCHFEYDDEDPAEPHVTEAIEFVEDVLSDRVILWSCLGAAGAYSIEHRPRFNVPRLVRRYLWSGPVRK